MPVGGRNRSRGYGRVSRPGAVGVSRAGVARTIMSDASRPKLDPRTVAHTGAIPTFPYGILWEDRTITSVANHMRKNGIAEPRCSKQHGDWANRGDFHNTIAEADGRLFVGTLRGRGYFDNKATVLTDVAGQSTATSGDWPIV
jgi:hypothetical protein